MIFCLPCEADADVGEADDLLAGRVASSVCWRRGTSTAGTVLGRACIDPGNRQRLCTSGPTYLVGDFFPFLAHEMRCQDDAGDQLAA